MPRTKPDAALNTLSVPRATAKQLLLTNPTPSLLPLTPLFFFKLDLRREKNSRRKVEGEDYLSPNSGLSPEHQARVWAWRKVSLPEIPVARRRFLGCLGVRL